jgi:hypothetical protein
MAGANLRKIMGEVPRAMEIVSHDDKGLVPVGRRKISPAKSFQKQGEYLAKVVRGETPLDETSADVVRQFLEAHHARHG